MGDSEDTRKFFKALREWGVEETRRMDEHALQLARYARISFDFEAATSLQQGVIVEKLKLKYSPQFSGRVITVPSYDLGALHFGRGPKTNVVSRAGLVCPREELREIGSTLQAIIQKYETIPDEEYEQAKSRDRITRVAVFGLGRYFQKVLGPDGVPLAPAPLITYQSGDANSRLLLERLVE